MTATPAVAANPKPHPHRGYVTAAWVLAGVVGTLVLGSYVGAQLQLDFAVRELSGLVVIGLAAAGTFMMLRAFDHGDQQRRHHHQRLAAIVIVAALVGWLVIQTAVNHHNNLAGALAALPFIAFAVWVIRRLDRNEKEPWRLIIAALLWGGVVANSLAYLINSVSAYFFAGHFFGAAVPLSNAFEAGFTEEMAKGVALVLLFLIRPMEFDDVVDGIVYGAMIGLGFNFTESVGYMARYGIADQLVTREIVGLFTSHVAYTAMIGAGLGVARQQSTAIRRLLAGASGFVAAIAAHFLWDAVNMAGAFPLQSDNTTVDTWIITPIETIVLVGPFLVLLGVLFYMGLRVEGARLAEQLQLEAATGDGAVKADEVDVLSNPRARLKARRAALGSGGPKAYRALSRLQGAQLDLAMERWHRARGETDEPTEAEDVLRKQVLALRG